MKKEKSKPKQPKPKPSSPHKCPNCGSKRVFAVRGNKGSHWFICETCNEDF